jgi:hypothetical protein
VGADATEDISSGDAAVWMSRDASAWTRVPLSRTLQDAEMTDVAPTDSGFIAVGGDGFPGGNVQLPGLRGPVAWQSADGSAWDLTPVPRPSERMLMEGITAVSGGWLSWGGGAPPGTGAVWTSRDGEAWAFAGTPSGDPWGPIGKVIAAPDGSLIAVGSAWRGGDEDTLAGIWRSADGGSHWDRIDVVTAGGPGALWDILWTGDRFVATGAQGRILQSANGTDWSAEPPDPFNPGVTMRRLILMGDVLIGFGSEDSPNGTTARIWIRSARPS